MKESEEGSFRSHVEDWGRTFSAVGIGMRTAGWPYVVFKLLTGIEVVVHSQELLYRGIGPLSQWLLEAAMSDQRPKAAPVDFDIPASEGEEPVPKYAPDDMPLICSAAAQFLQAREKRAAQGDAAPAAPLADVEFD